MESGGESALKNHSHSADFSPKTCVCQKKVVPLHPIWVHRINRSQIATSSEGDFSRSQIATLNGRGQNIKYLPYAFTENGIAMLSGVLRSPLAIATNIHIMRAFNAMRHFIGSQLEVLEPHSVRDMMRDHVKTLNKFYK